MVLTLRLIRGLLGFLAAYQLIGFLPVLAWLADWSQVTAGMFMLAGIKLTLMAVFFAGFYWLRPKINRTYKEVHNVSTRILPGFWSL